MRTRSALLLGACCLVLVADAAQANIPGNRLPRDVPVAQSAATLLAAAQQTTTQRRTKTRAKSTAPLQGGDTWLNPQPEPPMLGHPNWLNPQPEPPVPPDSRGVKRKRITTPR